MINPFLCRNREISSSERFSIASTVLSIRACFASLICLFLFFCSSQSLTIFFSFSFVSASTSSFLAFAPAVMAFLSKAFSFRYPNKSQIPLLRSFHGFHPVHRRFLLPASVNRQLLSNRPGISLVVPIQKE